MDIEEEFKVVTIIEAYLESKPKQYATFNGEHGEVLLVELDKTAGEKCLKIGYDVSGFYDDGEIHFNPLYIYVIGKSDLEEILVTYGNGILELEENIECMDDWFSALDFLYMTFEKYLKQEIHKHLCQIIGTDDVYEIIEKAATSHSGVNPQEVL